MPPDPEYVAARRVLLDVLAALGDHRKAVVLIGAQAVYQHVGAGDFAIAAYTTDADLALDPRLLDDEPLLAAALHAGGFHLARRPGTWSRGDVPVDLMVPEALGGSGRRGARLGPHGSDVARKARGIEAALVDNIQVRIDALEQGDDRAFQVAVAGLPALLVAKLHKIAEREGTPDRTVAKDGLDVLRILRHADLGAAGPTLSRLQHHVDAGLVVAEARGYLERLFGSRSAHGAQLAADACMGLEDPATIAASCEALAKALLREW